jgi:hypothetical protein
VLAELFALISPHLTEKQRRLLLGAGRGRWAAEAAPGWPASARWRPAVYAGVRELDAPPDPNGRIRRPGGGPKRLADTDPGLIQAKG